MISCQNPLNEIKPDLAGGSTWVFFLEILSDSPILHSRWLPFILWSDISLIDHLLLHIKSKSAQILSEAAWQFFKHSIQIFPSCLWLFPFSLFNSIIHTCILIIKKTHLSHSPHSPELRWITWLEPRWPFSQRKL